MVAVHHLLKHLAVHGDIKGLGHIHGAGKDFTAVPEEVVDGFENAPGTHVPGDAWLVGKLEVIQTEGVTEQDDDDPVYDLENEAADCNAPIVLAGVDCTKFVLDNGHKKGGKEEESGDMTMDEVALEDSGEDDGELLGVDLDTV